MWTTRQGMLSIVMPAFNEASRIEETLREVHDAAGRLFERTEIIVVDDGSRDATRESVRRAASRIPGIRLIGCDANRGKGQALKAGALRARGDAIAFVDADLDIHPRQLVVLLDEMDRTGAAVVVGSKHHPRSRVENYPAKRRLFSLGYYALVRLLFRLPIRDTQTGLKVFRRDALRDVVPRVLAKRFAFDLEMLAVAHRRGHVLVDAPIDVVFQRAFGRIHAGDACNTLVDTLGVTYRMYLRNHYARSHVDLFDRSIYVDVPLRGAVTGEAVRAEAIVLSAN